MSPEFRGKVHYALVALGGKRNLLQGISPKKTLIVVESKIDVVYESAIDKAG